MNKEIAIAFVTFGLVFGLVFFFFFGLPFIMGSTFGQRCTKAYPHDPAQQEWCVKRLNEGGTVYPKPASLEHPDG